jgi:hypothetical protein
MRVVQVLEHQKGVRGFEVLAIAGRCNCFSQPGPAAFRVGRVKAYVWFKQGHAENIGLDEAGISWV